jgi:hypothetical protein
MPERRMFSSDITSSDAFLDMPQSSRLLYYDLGMNADDDGFVGPKKIMRVTGASEDDIKVLITKRFVLPFQSGVVVIKHWLIHNLIRKDRYKPTRYLEEKSSLKIKENGAYTEAVATIGCQNDNQMATQVRLGKDSKEGAVAELSATTTPRQEFQEFLKSPESQIDRLVASCGANNDEYVRREVAKFVSYWTEPTPNGKKQRWEIQKTFDYKRRLATWLLKANEFTRPGQTDDPRQVAVYKSQK